MEGLWSFSMLVRLAIKQSDGHNHKRSREAMRDVPPLHTRQLPDSSSGDGCAVYCRRPGVLVAFQHPRVAFLQSPPCISCQLAFSAGAYRLSVQQTVSDDRGQIRPSRQRCRSPPLHQTLETTSQGGGGRLQKRRRNRGSRRRRIVCWNPSQHLSC